MFTGIVSHIGKLKNKRNATLTFSAPPSFLKQLRRGTSIAVNGACLTVTTLPTKHTFSLEVMPETVKRTMFGKINISDMVNLELPTTYNTFISGHIVLGHVDGVGVVEEIKKDGNSRILVIKAPKKLLPYIVPKGAICLNGISLTVVDVGKYFFTVSIIPFTWKNTMLKKIKIGNFLNIEVDILAKYVEKLVGKPV